MNRTRTGLFAALFLACSSHAAAQVSPKLIEELVYCSTLSNGLSLVATAAKQDEMRTLAGTFMLLAFRLAHGDQQRIDELLKASADRAAAKVVGTSAKERLEAIQSCGKTLDEASKQFDDDQD